MGLGPFGQFSTIRRSLLARVILIAAGVLTLADGTKQLTADQPPAKPKEKVDFKGKWDGQFVDNLKNDGKGEYEFFEEKDGQLRAKATWGQGEGMDLTGERIGPDALRLIGVHKGTTYRYVGGMENGDLVLGYTGHHKGKSHFGVSYLTRQRK